MGQQIIERDQTITQAEKTIGDANKIAQTQQDDMDRTVGQLKEKNL
jgi:signal transduction histidine kinase